MTEDFNGQLMLLRFEPNQVVQCWDFVLEALEKVIPPIERKSAEYFNNIYRGILSNYMHCWFAFMSGEVKALVITNFQYQVGGTKDLLIYCLYGIENLDISMYRAGFEYLKIFAKKNGCSRVVSYSNVERIIRVSKALGADTSYTFISIPVED